MLPDTFPDVGQRIERSFCHGKTTATEFSTSPVVNLSSKPSKNTWKAKLATPLMVSNADATRKATPSATGNAANKVSPSTTPSNDVVIRLSAAAGDELYAALAGARSARRARRPCRACGALFFLSKGAADAALRFGTTPTRCYGCHQDLLNRSQAGRRPRRRPRGNVGHARRSAQGDHAV